MANIDVTKLATKGAQTVCYSIGIYLFAFNLFAFKLSKGGSIYYLDKNQSWMATGAALITIGICIKNWKKL